jgi:hypothetical protein
MADANHKHKMHLLACAGFLSFPVYGYYQSESLLLPTFKTDMLKRFAEHVQAQALHRALIRRSRCSPKNHLVLFHPSPSQVSPPGSPLILWFIDASEANPARKARPNLNRVKVLILPAAIAMNLGWIYKVEC